MTETRTVGRPVDPDLFVDTPDGPRLLGAACRACGATTFPRQSSCPRCTATDMADTQLAPRGTLWTWTIQRFQPKPPYHGPDPFVPYGVGYVELPGQVMVESRLTENDPDRLRIGTEMELVIVPVRKDEDGTTVTTFAFRPTT